MLDHTLRGYKDRLLRPLVVPLDRVSPNVVTLLAMVVGLAAAVMAARQMVALGLVLWLASRILDGLDGLLARVHEQQTDFGGYLDIVADFVVYAALPIGLFLGRATTELGVSLAFLLGSFYVNAASWMYLSAILEKRSAGASARGELTTVTMPAGLVGGTETILFYAVFLIWPGALPWLFLAMAGLGAARRDPTPVVGAAPPARNPRPSGKAACAGDRRARQGQRRCGRSGDCCLRCMGRLKWR